jgi:hemerythrin
MIIVEDKIIETGLQEIDGDHHTLVDILNHLTSIQENISNVELSRILKILINYADNHFILEESYFEMVNYKLKKQHKTSHEKFKDYIQNNINRMNNDIDIKIDVKHLIKFLKNWIIKHINGYDFEFFKEFNETTQWNESSLYI